MVYLYGSTSGSLQIHQYRVALTLRLPSGGVFSSTPSFSSGSVMNSLSAVWTAADLNADFVGQSRHDIYCTISGLTPVLFFGQLIKRPPPPPYQCTAKTTNICSIDSNSLPPTGRLKRPDCRKWNYCCNAYNEFTSGWCRKEICFKQPPQTYDPVSSQCMSQAACQNPSAVLCLGGN